MKTNILIAVLVGILLTACANPLNRATSERYSEECAIAERNNRLDVAEQACYRALVNVDWGNLEPELKSQKLYNLGRIKRRLSKFDEAERLFKDSLAIEETLPSPSPVRIGRRLIELSASLAGQDKWAEGTQYLERALPAVDQFSGYERKYAAEVLNEYSKRLKKNDDIELASRFEAKSKALKGQ